MDARNFIEQYPGDIDSVCAAAGTKPIYLRQIANGHRNPSPTMAKRLEAASSGRMDAMSLLFPAKKAATSGASA